MSTELRVKTRIINPEIKTKPLQYAKPGDAGIDLTATSVNLDEEGNIVYGTNRAFEIPDGYVGLLFPRSSNSNYDVRLSNCVGVLDSGYRGEVMFKFKPAPAADKMAMMIIQTLKDYGVITEENLTGTDDLNFDKNITSKIYQVGDRIGQMIILPFPKIIFEEAEILSETERGANGYGSTGK